MINSMTNEPIKVKTEGNKLGSFCEINSLITFVSSVRRLINWPLSFFIKERHF